MAARKPLTPEKALRTKSKRKKPAAKRTKRRRSIFGWVWRICARALVICVALGIGLVVLGAAVDPPTNVYMWSESRRLEQELKHDWVPLENIAPVMARSAVAAEDANFCEHWGFDVTAIKAAIAEGSNRGASTISQQVVKNVYLWQGRSWVRKALEATITPVLEAIWSKRRIIEVYLNIAEFDEGVFGVQAASQHYFGVDAADLSRTQASRLAAILPSPKKRSASRPSNSVQKRARQIRSGAATILADGRAACFES